VRHRDPQQYLCLYGTDIVVFSCKDFDSETVIGLLRHYFGIKAWNQKDFPREAPDLNS